MAEIKTKADFETFRGKLAGLAVLMSAPAAVDLKKIEAGTPRYTDAELKKINDAVAPAPAAVAPAAAVNPDNVTALERIRRRVAARFYIITAAFADGSLLADRRPRQLRCAVRWRR